MEELVIEVCVEIDLEQVLQDTNLTTLCYLSSIDLAEDEDEHLDNMYNLVYTIYCVELDTSIGIENIGTDYLLSLTKKFQHHIRMEISYREGILPRVVDLEDSRRLLYKN